MTVYVVVVVVVHLYSASRSASNGLHNFIVHQKAVRSYVEMHYASVFTPSLALNALRSRGQ